MATRGSTGTVGDALLATHRSYLPAMRPLLAAGLVRGMAHITGGGIEGNIPRMLPKGLGVELAVGRLGVPPIFDLIQRQGGIAFEEMTRVFNLGLGWVFVTSEADAERSASLAPDALPVGRVVADAGGAPACGCSGRRDAGSGRGSPRVAVLISGRGSNLLALIEAIERGEIPAEIVLVVSNRAEAGGLALRAAHGPSRR